MSPYDPTYAFTVSALIDELEPYASRIWTSEKQLPLLRGLRTIQQRIADGSMDEPWNANEIESIVLLSSAVTAIAGTELRLATTKWLEAVREDRLRTDHEVTRRLVDQLRPYIISADPPAPELELLAQKGRECDNGLDTAAFTSVYRPIQPKRSGIHAFESALHALQEQTSIGSLDLEEDLRRLSVYFDQVESGALDPPAQPSAAP